MNSMSLDEICLRGLLRWVGTGSPSPYSGSVETLRYEDLDALRMWWALSEPVGRLALRLVEKQREVSPTLDDFRREVSGELPGPPDAAASMLLQTVTLDPAAFVVMEASSSWFSGPNRVLAKTLKTAQVALKAGALHARGGLFDLHANKRLALLDCALKVAPIREVLSTPAGRSRIVAYEKRQASKARSPLYKQSWLCASILSDIEAFKADTIKALLASDLLPGMEVWRKFELATILEVAEALSGATGAPVVLDASFAAGRPAATIGDLELRWQRAMPKRPSAFLDPGEVLAGELAFSLGVSKGTSRADITIERAGRILSIIECKWFSSPDSAPAAILEATSQLVGYARDIAHAQEESDTGILARSIVALAHRGPAEMHFGAPVCCIGFSDFGTANLAPWAAMVSGIH
ncbi:hypothetical protein LGD64_002206 [Escherichia coli]|uniref:hypothetical protein n=1 Tax=Escherichia coli TaxID=562 RepID=UPI0005CAC14B|nr:hypothetical protein [Escherichia coli]EHT2172702.1 hypothetical protein [Escherichia coli O168]EHY2109520.1 hypothetical protein [Escherichia coli O157]ANP08917.1 hypothetical protein CP48_17970 [Escherichia coli]EAB0395128.1 hypothetical protein [Escherichia coli]EEG9012181.1 hypothetical protein [Escherichia coli]